MQCNSLEADNKSPSQAAVCGCWAAFSLLSQAGGAWISPRIRGMKSFFFKKIVDANVSEYIKSHLCICIPRDANKSFLQALSNINTEYNKTN